MGHTFSKQIITLDVLKALIIIPLYNMAGTWIQITYFSSPFHIKMTNKMTRKHCIISWWSYFASERRWDAKPSMGLDNQQNCKTDHWKNKWTKIYHNYLQNVTDLQSNNVYCNSRTVSLPEYNLQHRENHWKIVERSVYKLHGL